MAEAKKLLRKTQNQAKDQIQNYLIMEDENRKRVCAKDTKLKKERIKEEQ